MTTEAEINALARKLIVENLRAALGTGAAAQIRSNVIDKAVEHLKTKPEFLELVASLKKSPST